jgi:hypothetical protein
MLMKVSGSRALERAVGDRLDQKRSFCSPLSFLRPRHSLLRPQHAPCARSGALAPRPRPSASAGDGRGRAETAGGGVSRASRPARAAFGALDAPRSTPKKPTTPNPNKNNR